MLHAVNAVASVIKQNIAVSRASLPVSQALGDVVSSPKGSTLPIKGMTISTKPRDRSTGSRRTANAIIRIINRMVSASHNGLKRKS